MKQIFVPDPDWKNGLDEQEPPECWTSHCPDDCKNCPDIDYEYERKEEI